MLNQKRKLKKTKFINQRGKRLSISEFVKKFSLNFNYSWEILWENKTRYESKNYSLVLH